MEQEELIQKREFFRLRYPRNERPRAKLLGRDFWVCEISEQGTRILFTNSHPVTRGISITGSIRFHDGEMIEIKGQVLRLDDGELVAQLSKGPDLKRMTKEQIYIRKKYPGFFNKQKSVNFIK
ncbi:hypothetical protein MACH09_24890 [Vibrio sp. MACH09]|uniref:PilZ domain-containing protein n=1 Tax=unclassified Vibrio TaxID=2614977 RepID=UPI001493A0CC|nr:MULTISPECIES: PilZ domain-containing protein [unclassified Vibrio]NOI68245.1 PilZ domain-containing protein [Vibrio sp. 99-8-1]GLO61981.1 hypothetical protein MACH09_24890 [Vibrio sp. MACH09]